MALAANMCRNIESSQKRDVILEPLSLLKCIRPVQTSTPLIPSDTTTSPLKSTRLGGHLISCFVVGGECRLCLPQILAMVLPSINNTVVQKLFIDLQIHLSVANPEQLQSFHLAGLLPRETAECILVRKSDAERLVAALLQQNCSRVKNPEHREGAIPVCHDSFGGCTGLLLPALVVDEASEAIECAECKFLFSGEQFASHTHSTEEIRGICHWGFDSSNWMHYLHLPEHLEENLEAQQKLAAFKDFDVQQKTSALLNSQLRCTMKRTADSKVEELESMSTRTAKVPKCTVDSPPEQSEELRKSMPTTSNNNTTTTPNNNLNINNNNNTSNNSPLLNQFPPLSMQNLQLLLAYQNAGLQYSLSQQLAKLATFSLPPSLSFPATTSAPRFEAPKTIATPMPPPATFLSEPSTSSSNTCNDTKYLLNDVCTSVGAASTSAVDNPTATATSVPSLEKLLEEHLSTNVFTLARMLLEDERLLELRKRQQLEAQNEQLRLHVEQLRRDNALYQSVFAGSGIQDIRSLAAKTAIF